MPPIAVVVYAAVLGASIPTSPARTTTASEVANAILPEITVVVSCASMGGHTYTAELCDGAVTELKRRLVAEKLSNQPGLRWYVTGVPDDGAVATVVGLLPVPAKARKKAAALRAALHAKLKEALAGKSVVLVSLDFARPGQTTGEVAKVFRVRFTATGGILLRAQPFRPPEGITPAFLHDQVASWLQADRGWSTRIMEKIKDVALQEGVEL